MPTPNFSFFSTCYFLRIMLKHQLEVAVKIVGTGHYLKVGKFADSQILLDTQHPPAFRYGECQLKKVIFSC